jgi:hypothetical protein
MSAPKSTPITQYTITRGVFRSSYDITTTGQHGQPLYHVDNSHWTPGKPDLTFHAGANTTGPIAGVSKYRHFSSDTEIGLGDPSQPHAIEWFRLNRDSIMSGRYSIRITLGITTTGRNNVNNNQQQQQPRTFTWKRTRALSRHSGGLKLVDESDRVVAVFGSGGSFSTSGQMDIYVQYGERFQLLVLVSGLALREKLARARKAAAAGAGAGGGGGGA